MSKLKRRDSKIKEKLQKDVENLRHHINLDKNKRLDKIKLYLHIVHILNLVLLGIEVVALIALMATDHNYIQENPMDLVTFGIELVAEILTVILIHLVQHLLDDFKEDNDDITYLLEIVEEQNQRLEELEQEIYSIEDKKEAE